MDMDMDIYTGYGLKDTYTRFEKWTIFKQVALKFSKLAHINTLFLVTGIFSVQLIKRRLRTCLKWNTFTYVFDIRVLSLTYDLYSFWYLENRKMVWVMHSAYIYIQACNDKMMLALTNTQERQVKKDICIHAR